MTRGATFALQPGEIFSSWLVRYALASGCDPLSLTGSLWRGERPWTRDLDRGVPEAKLAALGRQVGDGADALRNAFLPGYVPLAEVSPALPIWPWILSVGTRNRRRHGGLQFCPRCLTEDRAPYYRIRWRLAWVMCCDVHGVMLLDRCTSCQAPVEPHRLAAADRSPAVGAG